MKIWFDNIQYNDLFVLESGSLAFDYGKTTVISGESGSGKTSLFYSIINNSEISSYETLSYLSQSYIFLEDLTIQQHINLIQTTTIQGCVNNFV